MLGSIMTALNVLSFGYDFAKKVTKDIKQKDKNYYKDFKKMPRSRQHQFVRDEMRAQAKAAALAELKEEYKAQIKEELKKDMEKDAVERAWDHVREVVSDNQVIQEMLERSKNRRNKDG